MVGCKQPTAPSMWMVMCVIIVMIVCVAYCAHSRSNYLSIYVYFAARAAVKSLGWINSPVLLPQELRVYVITAANSTSFS